MLKYWTLLTSNQLMHLVLNCVWSVAIAIELPHSGIMEALPRTSPNSNSSITKDRVNSKGQGEPWLICKEHPGPLLPCPCQMTPSQQVRQAVRLACVRLGRTAGRLERRSFDLPRANRLTAHGDVACSSQLCPKTPLSRSGRLPRMQRGNGRG